jgi:hypothetical protein
MYSEKSQATEQAAATLIANTSTIEGVAPTGVYTVECFDANGNLKWSDSIKNLVVTQGKNDMLDQYFAGISYTAAWYLGLVDGATSPTYAAGNTLASHSGWTENTSYSGNRPAVTWGAASSGSKSTTATAFNISGSATIAGAFMCTVATGTSGILYSAGNFTGGSRVVASGDTLNVTYTATLT